MSFWNTEIGYAIGESVTLIIILLILRKFFGLQKLDKKIEKIKKEKWKTEWKTEQEENARFRAESHKSDMPSYEEFRAKKLAEQEKS